VPVRVLLDTSASMTAISDQKFQYARQLAAALCYVALVRLDTISIQPFGEKLGERFVWGGGRHRFSPVMNYLEGLKSGGRGDFHASVRQFISRYPQPGLLIVISDFLDETGCEKSLQYLADFGHELVLIQIWSDEDRRPPWVGELELVDAETNIHVKMQIDDQARQRYTASFDNYAGALQKVALRNSGRYVGVAASTALEEVIFGALVRAKGLV
jgi:uncharacterized protein (DUF58 family)